MRPGLERIEALLDALGRPEQRYRLAQVGGTNGKGSVAAMLASILGSAGLRVGLYTSPHLVSFRERIRINGAAIPEDSVVDGVDALGTLVARLDATMFEATTALALDHFAREAVDMAVLEVGLGGRLDATTVGTPEVAVIARVDLDHQAVLGSTLGEIAAEKAAIIRGGVAFSAAQAPEAARVIADRAAAVGVPLLVEGRDLSVVVEQRGPDGQRLTCAGPGWSLAGLELGMSGSFQPSNALLAVGAARALGAPETAIRAGLARAWWPGRFQVLRHKRGFLVLDGAHNPAGAATLALRPERIILAMEPQAGMDNSLPGVVEFISYLGATIDMHVRISPKERVVVQIPNRAGNLSRKVGGQVYVAWPAANGIVFSGDGT
jgi:dihydrofolate synthase/folylpolyglutamate synthase